MDCSTEKPEKVCQLWCQSVITKATSGLIERIIKIEAFSGIAKAIGSTSVAVLILLTGFFFGQNGEAATMKNDIKNIKEILSRLVPSADKKTIGILPEKKETTYCKPFYAQKK